MRDMDRAGVSQEMKQGMVATTSMQLFMRTLQANTLELSQLIREAMESNPVLEELSPREIQSDEESWEDFAESDPEQTTRRDFAFESLHALPTLAEHLREQVMQSALEPDTEQALLLLTEELDHRGFFEEAPEKVAERKGIAPVLLKRALATLRELDPPGVGARDLRDSLLIQLEQLDEGNGLAAELLRYRWDDMVQHRYDSAAKALGVSAESVQAAALRIARLNPNPGAGFLREEPPVAPDLIVEVDQHGAIHTLLAESVLPTLTMNPAYKEMLATRADNKELHGYLSKCFREGRELIRAITARQDTILNIGQAIVAKQKEFFLHSTEALVPLTMDEIASKIGIHPSTVSRAVNGKYLLCNYGLFELRYFFQSGVQAESADGEDASALAAAAVQLQIKKLINAEDPNKPLSDAKLETLLTQQGITVARRTVAKYREQMKILPARLRKRY